MIVLFWSLLNVMLLNSKRNISKGRQISLIKTGEWIRNKNYKWNRQLIDPKVHVLLLRLQKENIADIKFLLIM